MSIPDVKGKKRIAPPAVVARPPKKIKLKRGAKGAFAVHSAGSTEGGVGEASYPALIFAPASDCVTEEVPILHYTFDIHYTKGVGTQRAAWKAEQQQFIQFLDSVPGTPGSSTLDLGQTRLGKYQHRAVGSSDILRDADGNPSWLLLLPTFEDDIAFEDYDYSTSNCQDLLMASSILSSIGKVAIDAHLKMVILPSDKQTPSGDLPFKLQVDIYTSLLVPEMFEPPARRQSKSTMLMAEDAQRRLLSFVYDANKAQPRSIDIAYFYSILGPAPGSLSLMAKEALQPETLVPTLLPFQQRSVAWLLEKEGMMVTESGKIVPKDHSTDFSFWDTIQEGNHTWYYNRLSGALTTEPPSRSENLGAILAEEPGLGKTLEMITLMLINPAPPERNPSVTRWDPVARLDVRAVKSSLIVTPPSLASQWVDEIAVHAPKLKVLVYDGWNKVPVPITRSALEAERLKELEMKESEGKGKGKRKPKKKATKRKKAEDMDVDEDVIDLTRDESGELMDWYTYVQQFDVVITTYQVLRTDFNVARAAPVRPRREDVVYYTVERTRSPLVMVEWNRVIMDEVQMVGGGKVEDMVSLIPRLSSFAVSGTPARAHVSDLMHVLRFLRVDDVVGSTKLWNRLQAPAFTRDFAEFFQTYAVRTMKNAVKDELTIPEQTRYLVPIELGLVERHIYDQALESVLIEIGLDSRGVASSSGWEVDGTILRAAIRKLRAICTHPQVGQLQRRGDNLFKPGKLKTIEEVLENMIDLSWRNIIEDWRSKLVVLVRYARLQQQDEGNHNRYRHGLDTLLRTEKEVNNQIVEIEQYIAEHDEKGKILKQQAAIARAEHDMETDPASPNHKGKGKEVDGASDIDDEDDDDDDGDFPHTPAGEEHRTKRRALKQRLREAKLILHQVMFLLGDVNHVLGETHAESEDLAYDKAEAVRKDLLKGSMKDAQDAMKLLQGDVSKKRVPKDDLFIAVAYLEKGGVRSALLNEEVNVLIEDILNEQSELLWEWRSHIIELLTLKLDSGGSDADGQEYQRTLDSQGEVEAYIQAYAALLADRREVLVNERTLLAYHDVREKKLRHTKAAIRAAAEENFEMLDIDEMEPEQADKLKELNVKRKKILKRSSGRAIKSVLVDLSAVLAKITSDKDIEKELVKQCIAGIRKLISVQSKCSACKLENDLTLIRKAFNQRVQYFRQLQEISDAVTEVTWEGTLMEALQECMLQETELEKNVQNKRARYRYLSNLATNKDAGDEEEEEEARMCILCRCDFSRGFLTQCGHVFCEGCMKAWLLRKEGRTCPICRVSINTDNVHRFSIGVNEPEPPPKPSVNGEPIPRSLRQTEYNKISSCLNFAEILDVECYGDYGTKIQTLVRHILHLEFKDPGAKSIVFSAWADSLYIVERALRDNGVSCLRIDQNTKGNTAAKRFRTDPTLRVLLLHGERENAGLNITCASRVFLLESVVHHSFEVQAIARIDRMGQTRPTEVFCYFAEDTIEQNILDLAARQGLSLYTKENSAGTLNVSSFVNDNDKKAVDSPAKKAQKGDFIYKIDDMLAILFPHMFEEIDYLIANDENAYMDVSGTSAIAGTSRLASVIAEASARR
ncbi:SNF2 family N-terminal domain-containing protein [Cyathus striatus]|nr:SNF2 family N-terminal domain-containing protein [Cyathus striatus]